MMDSSSSPIVCQEVFDENSQPSAEEISDYAYQIGIDPVSESHLLPLAKDGLMQALPEPWKAFYDEKIKAHYYYNPETKKTQWEHPVDNIYKDLVVKARTASEKDVSVHDDTCASVQDILTSDDLSKHYDKSKDESLAGDNTFSNRAKSSREDTKPFSLKQRLSDLKIASLTHSMDSLPRPQRYPVSFGKPPVAPTHKPSLAKQNSEIIDLNINILNDKDFKSATNVSTNSDKGVPLSGKGLMFLKTRHSETSLFDAKVLSAMSAKDRKGILRESEKAEKPTKDKEEVSKDVEEDKKSVRFNLSSTDYTAEVLQSPSSNSSSEQVERMSVLSTNETLQSNNQIRNLSGVKLAPLSIGTAGSLKGNAKIGKRLKSHSLDEYAEDKPVTTGKRLLKPPPADFIKPELFQKKFDKISDIIKPISVDSDSDSEIKPRPRSPLNPPKVKLSINLMESIESETSLDSPDKDIDNIDLNLENESLVNSKPTIKVNDVSPPDEKLGSNIEGLNVRIENLKMELDREYEVSERLLRAEMKQKIVKLEEDIKREQEVETDRLRRKLNALNEENKMAVEKAISDVEEQHKANMEQIISKLRSQLECERDAHIADLKERMRQETEKIKSEIENKHRDAVDHMEKEHSDQIKKLKMKFEQDEAEIVRELRESMTEKLEAEKSRLTFENTAAIESMRAHHESACEVIREDYRKEVSVLRNEQCAHLDELRGRRHNDQRALQDKYRCLKEKYLRLKTDVKMSIERKNKRREQSLTTGSETEKSNSHKHIEAERCKETTVAQKMTPIVYNVEDDNSNNSHGPKRAQTNKNSNNFNGKRDRSVDKPLTRIGGRDSEGETSLSANDSGTASRRNPKTSALRPDFQKPPKAVSHVTKEKAQTDYHDSSDAADAFEKRNVEKARGKRKSFTKTKSASTSRLNHPTFGDRSCSPVENLRQQLKKLEDLEDQFPDLAVDSSAYTLRYPFGECGRGTELEFMAHRALVERERLRRARTALAARARHLRRARQQPTPGHQEEIEQTELEISLHRMRALLGEKVIRLRHIEAALSKLAANRYVAKELSMSELSSSESDAAGNAVEMGNEKFFEDTQDLMHNLNSEIQNIWQTLEQRQNHNNVMQPQQIAIAPRITPPTHYQPWPIFITTAPQHTAENLTASLQNQPDAGILEKAKELREWLERQSM